MFRSRMTTANDPSGPARDRILNAATRSGEAHGSLPALFTPTRRLLLGAALPLLLAMGLLLTLDRGLAPPAGIETGPRVTVFKQGNHVRFHVTNGGKAHHVSRSTQPDRFEAASMVELTDGEYIERLSDRADLVFYRID